MPPAPRDKTRPKGTWGGARAGAGGAREGAGRPKLPPGERLTPLPKERREVETADGGEDYLDQLIGPSPRRGGGDAGEHFAAFARHCRVTQGAKAGDELVLYPELAEFFGEALALDENKRRIYRRAGLIIPRKNAKTTAAAVLSLYCVSPADGEHRPVVIQAAGSRAQAGETWNHATAFVSDPKYGSEKLKPVFRTGVHRIKSPANGGEIKRVAGDGKLNHSENPHLVIADELHAWTTVGQVENWRALTTAGGAREDPMIIFLTTAGQEEFGPLWDLLERIRNSEVTQVEQRGLCHKIFRNERSRMLVWEFAVPAGTPFDDLDTWKAANPAPWRTKERLAEDLADELIDEPTKRRLYGNEWVGQKDRWIDDDHWNAAYTSEEPTPETVLVCGVDAARTRDTTALAWAWQNEEGKTIVRTRIWSVRDDVAADVIVPGGRLDNNLARDYIRHELMPRYRCQLLFYDERYFDTQANDLSNDGMTVAEMHQGKTEMQAAWDEFYDDLYAGAEPTLLHGGEGEPALREHVRSAVGLKTERGWRVSKTTKHGRPIDGLAAAVMARYGAAHFLDYVKARPRIMVL